MRRATAFLAAAVSSAIVGGIANADIIVYSVRSAGTGAANTTTGVHPTDVSLNKDWTGNQGFDVVRFYAKFVNGTTNIENTASNSHGLGSIAGTLISTQGFKFDMTKVATAVDATRANANLDLKLERVVDRINNDLIDVHADNANVNTQIGIQNWDSYLVNANPFGAGGFYMASSDPNAVLLKSNSAVAIKLAADGNPQIPRSITNSTSDTDPRYIYQSPVVGYNWAAPGAVNPNPDFIKAIRVEGALPNGDANVDPSAKSSNPNGARGALVAVAVVPTGSTVRFVSQPHGVPNTQTNPNAEAGGIGDDANHVSQFDVTDAIPEPGSISLLTLGAIGLLARRSRKQA